MLTDVYDEIVMANDVRVYMTNYIREHFASLLGPHLALLDQPDGLEKIQRLIESGSIRG
jgi:hypothetical protein